MTSSSVVGFLAVSAHMMLVDHVVGASVLLPGVGYLEMAAVATPSSNKDLSDVKFVRPCILPIITSRVRSQHEMRISHETTDSFEIASRGAVEDVFVTHAMGKYLGYAEAAELRPA